MNNLTNFGVAVVKIAYFLKHFFMFKAIKAFTWICFYIGKWAPKDFNGYPLRMRFRMWFYRISYHQWLWGMMEFNESLESTKEDRRLLLKEWANPLCHVCFGRGHEGFNEASQTFVVCKCTKKRIEEARRAQNAGKKIGISSTIVDVNGDLIRK